MKKIFKLKEEVWLYPGETANWHFVYIDKKPSNEITKNFGHKRRGWSSFPVSVTIGKTKWATSIFFDKKSECYLLPLKALIRRKEGIMRGDKINFSIKIEV